MAMGSNYKYVNLNPFPIYLPTRSGINQLFRADPPEETTDPWFSRFCGPKQLTRLPLDVKQSAATGQLPVKPSKIVGQLKLEEETKDYAKKSGIYMCKHCETFRTGSIVLFQEHLKTYHKMDEQDQKSIPISSRPAPARTPEFVGDESMPVEEAVVMAAKAASLTTQLPEQVPVVTPEPVDQTEVAKVEKLPDKIFECNQCGKTFGSDHGLKIHTARMHGVPVSV